MVRAYRLSNPLVASIARRAGLLFGDWSNPTVTCQENLGTRIDRGTRLPWLLTPGRDFRFLSLSAVVISAGAA